MIMILNDNINEFDKTEERIDRTMKRKRRTLKQYIQRIFYLIDSKLFETTYKDEYEKQNVIIDKQTLKITKLERELKKYEREKMGK